MARSCVCVWISVYVSVCKRATAAPIADLSQALLGALRNGAAPVAGLDLGPRAGLGAGLHGLPAASLVGGEAGVR